MRQAAGLDLAPTRQRPNPNLNPNPDPNRFILIGVQTPEAKQNELTRNTSLVAQVSQNSVGIAPAFTVTSSQHVLWTVILHISTFNVMKETGEKVLRRCSFDL